MAIGIRQLEWLNHNSQRAYPLTASATRKDVSGSFVLPDNFLVALYLPVHWNMNVVPHKFFIRSVAAYANGVSLTVGYAAEGGTVNVASAVVARSAHTQYQVYNLGGIGEYADSRGYVVIDGFSQLDLQPAGLFQFELAGSQLEADCIRPAIRGVVSVQVDNSTGLSSKMYGNIRLQAGRNIRLTPIVEEGEDPVILIDAIDSSGFVDPCVCQDDAPPIRTINGVGPDNSGNIQIIGNECMDITTAGNVLAFEDVCSAPCCGCEELEAITQAMEALSDKAATLEMFLTNLESRVTQMDTAVLGSRVTDRGCDAECEPVVD
jgi:hypothetical protein